MSQVKLIVCKGFGSETRPFEGEAEVIDTGIRVPEDHEILSVIRTDFDADEHGDRQSSDDMDPVLHIRQVNGLIGRVLTLGDALFSDPKQRKAAKDLLRQAVWDWYTSQNDTMLVTEAWRRDKFPKTTAMQKQEHEEIFGKTE